MSIGEQIILVDRECTIAAYKAVTRPWADEFRCVPCRNFAAQRTTAFSSEFLSLLSRLGIDPAKESEVFGCYPLRSGKRQYSGWFFLCGTLERNGKGVELDNGASYYVRGPGNMPAPDTAFEPHPLALEFTIEIPWVLADEDADKLYGPIPR